MLCRSEKQLSQHISHYTHDTLQSMFYNTDSTCFNQIRKLFWTKSEGEDLLVLLEKSYTRKQNNTIFRKLLKIKTAISVKILKWIYQYKIISEKNYLRNSSPRGIIGCGVLGCLRGYINVCYLTLSPFLCCSTGPINQLWLLCLYFCTASSKCAAQHQSRRREASRAVHNNLVRTTITRLGRSSRTLENRTTF